jgi:tetratricopeptide (TPR) repeat protein
MADVYFEDGDYQNANAFYGKGIEANSDHVRSVVGRTRVQIARGQRVNDAAMTLEEVLEKPADQMSPRLTAMALTAMAELRLYEQKPDEAIKFADGAIAAFPKFAWAHFAKARALASQQDLAAAAALDKALALDRFVPLFYFTGAQLMNQVGDPAKALAVLDGYNKALKEDDRFFLAYGNQLNLMGRHDEALAYFEKAIDFNNWNGPARYAKGAVLFDVKKDIENARKELLLALEVQEFYPDVHIKLGDILFHEKDYAGACTPYAQALVQMKQLQFSRDRLGVLRELINPRLHNVVTPREIAMAWME